MRFIQGQDRTQAILFPVSLDASIDPDNEVRIIDLFVDSLQLKDFGFRVDFPENGRPAYHPADILKLYIYGYMNKVRSSRDLEKECKRNIEVMWLLKSLQPDHNTISNFRRDNPKAIKKVFRVTVQMAKHFNLIGGRLLAGDSSKFRAQNSKKNNFNQKKIARHIGYIDNKVDEYNKKLAEAEQEEHVHINDSKAMGNMLQRAKTILGNNSFTALYDKGYHTGSEFDIADTLDIEVMVAIPALSRSSHAPDPAYDMEHFVYNEQNDTYTCPQGHTMTTNGTWHKSSSGSMFQQYKTRNCKHCRVRPKCTKSAENGKVIQRRKYAQNIENNRIRIEQNEATYKKRQAIVEHPYGTIKRQWGFSYITTKKFIKRASADVGLMFVAYNIRRIINILGKNELRNYLEQIVFPISGLKHTITLILLRFKAVKFSISFVRSLFESPLKWLKFELETIPSDGF